MRRHLLSAAIALLALSLQHPRHALAAESRTLVSQHDRAIAAARAGRFEEALPVLDRLAQQHPDQPSYAWDRIAVLGWAGRAEEVLRAVETRPLGSDAPAWAHEAVARAARDLKRWDPAVAAWRQSIAVDASRLEPRMGLAQTLLDRRDTEQGDLAEAAGLIEAAARAHPEHREVLAARAALAETLEDWPSALAFRQRMLALDPHGTEAWRGLLRAARQLGAPQLAQELAEAHPGHLDAPTAALLEADRTAIGIRWARIEESLQSGEARFRWADAALASSQPVLAQLQSDAASLDLGARRKLFDRIMALALRHRHAEARALHASLQEAGIEVPAWALGAAADAYLSLREPEAAIPLYRRVLEEDPHEPGAALGLFYALVEAERLPEALAWIDAFAARMDALGGREAADPRAVEARAAVAMARVFADRPHEAEPRARALLAAAPMSPLARTTWASVQVARGRPRQADEEVRRALAVAPDSAALRAERVPLLLGTHDFREAQLQLAEAREWRPEDVVVRRAQRDWDLHRMPELSMEAGYGDSSGGTPTGSHDWQLESMLWSPPLAQDWRVFLRDWRTQARFEAGSGRWQRTGAGLEWRVPGWRLSAELASAAPDTSDPAVPDAVLDRRSGVTLAARWLPSDAWSAGIALDTLSTGVPLRARAAGVRGDELSLDTAWSPHESRRISAGVSALDFSDGNRRRSASLGWLERWTSGPRLRVETLATLYASRNSMAEAAYFNPERDFSASVDGTLDWLSWRRYENTFRQRLVLTAGRYWQRDFGSGAIAALRWEHVWELDRALRLRYGIGRTVRPFDGDTTARNDVTFAFNWRF